MHKSITDQVSRKAPSYILESPVNYHAMLKIASYTSHKRAFAGTKAAPLLVDSWCFSALFESESQAVLKPVEVLF